MTENIDPSQADPGNTALSGFLVAKVKYVTSPINLSQLCREFQESFGSNETIPELNQRLIGFRQKVHKSPNFDFETKVKLLFALSAPIDYRFLHRLKRSANLKLDESNRITEYESKDGELCLSGTHPIIDYKKGDDKVLEFLAKKTANSHTPITDTAFLKEFKAVYGISEYSVERYRRMKEKIYESKRFDEEIKIRMMFVCGASVPDYALPKLQENAILILDRQDRMTSYESHDGRITIKRRFMKESGSSSQSNRTNLQWARVFRRIDSPDSQSDEEYDSDEEEEDYEEDKMYEDALYNLVKFVSDKCEYAISPLSIHGLATEFQEESGSLDGHGCIRKRIDTYRKRIISREKLDHNTKIKHLFALSVPVDSNFLKKLRGSANVEVDGQKRISKYQSYDGSLGLYGTHSFYSKSRSKRINNRQRNEEGAMEVEYFDVQNDESYVDNDEIQVIEQKEVKIEENDLISHHKVLKSIRGIVRTLNSPNMTDLENKINAKLEVLRNCDEWILVGKVLPILETCLHSVEINASMKPENECRSLKEFLLLLRSSVVYFHSPTLHRLEDQLREMLQFLSLKDMYIPVETIQTSLEAAINNLSQ